MHTTARPTVYRESFAKENFHDMSIVIVFAENFCDMLIVSEFARKRSQI